jgi:hypothetical protein
MVIFSAFACLLFAGASARQMAQTPVTRLQPAPSLRPTPAPVASVADARSLPAAADPASRNLVETQRLIDETDFKAPLAWRVTANRTGTTPRAAISTTVGNSSPGSLVLSGNGNADAAGYWERAVAVNANQTYRLTAFYRYARVKHPRQTIHARIDWRDAAGERVAAPDYIAQTFPAGAWRRIDCLAKAPAGAVEARIQLGFQWSAAGRVWWDDVRFSEVACPRPAHGESRDDQASSFRFNARRQHRIFCRND